MPDIPRKRYFLLPRTCSDFQTIRFRFDQFFSRRTRTARNQQRNKTEQTASNGDSKSNRVYSGRRNYQVAIELRRFANLESDNYVLVDFLSLSFSASSIRRQRIRENNILFIDISFHFRSFLSILFHPLVILHLSFSPTLTSFAFILIRHSSSLLSFFGRWLLRETKRHPNGKPCCRKGIEVTDGTAAENPIDWREIVRLGEFSRRIFRRASFRLEETRSILTGHVIAS